MTMIDPDDKLSRAAEGFEALATDLLDVYERLAPVEAQAAAEAREEDREEALTLLDRVAGIAAESIPHMLLVADRLTERGDEERGNMLRRSADVIDAKLWGDV